MKKKENNQTEFDAKAPRKPEYSGDGIAVWVNQDKNNNPYLTIKIIGHNTINAFPRNNEDKKWFVPDVNKKQKT